MPSAFEVLIEKHLSPKAQSRMLAAAAKKVIAKAQAENDQAAGRKGPPPRITVDGRKGAPLESVRPDGEIVVQFNTGTDLVTWILFELQKHSPVKTGRYEKGHLAFVDGKPYTAGENLSEAREVVIINPLPYARKVERGQGRAPDDGVYQVVAMFAQKRYSTIASVYFAFRPIRDGKLLQSRGVRELEGMVTRRTGMTGKAANREASKRRRAVDEARVPAIIVQFKA